MKSAPMGLALAGVAALAVFAAPPSPAPAADGKEIFLANKCNSCHSIKSQSVVKKADPAEEPAKEGDRKPPDLSDVGKKRKADWIAQYMMKAVDNDGEKHRKKFKGTEADLKILAAWLETLKLEKKAAK